MTAGDRAGLAELRTVVGIERYRQRLGQLEFDYVAGCQEAERLARRRTRRVQALVGTLAALLALGGVGWWQQDFLREQYLWRWKMGPAMLTAEQEKEKAANPGLEFAECLSSCPTMVVVPAGKFMMGSPENEEGHDYSEAPQHEATIAKPFAVGRTEVTFAEWDACVAAGACSKAADEGEGRDDRPVINVSWDDTKQYVAWLSRTTGKEYRLLSEAEWEYAARAGNSGPYGRLNMLKQEGLHNEAQQQTQAGGYLDDAGNYIPFSDATSGIKERYSFTDDDDDVQLDQLAWYRSNSNGMAHPVGKKAANAFGLYDMHGNAAEWVEDTYHTSYEGAPTDGSPWVDGDTSWRVIRGGSWYGDPQDLRSTYRGRNTSVTRSFVIGFRVARTLNP